MSDCCPDCFKSAKEGLATFCDVKQKASEYAVQIKEPVAVYEQPTGGFAFEKARHAIAAKYKIREIIYFD